MLGFAVYCDNYDKILVAHLPIKDDIVKKNKLILLKEYSNRDIKNVSLALNNFISGLNVSSTMLGCTLDIKIVPEIQKYLQVNIDNNCVDDLIGKMSLVYPSLCKFNNVSFSVN